MGDMSVMNKIAKTAKAVKLNPFQANALFQYPLKTTENL